MQGLNKVKANKRRKLKERTEATVAQLEKQQAKENWTEVLNLCALLYVGGFDSLLLCKTISQLILAALPNSS
jgi:hypothetical protein